MALPLRLMLLATHAGGYITVYHYNTIPTAHVFPCCTAEIPSKRIRLRTYLFGEVVHSMVSVCQCV